MSASGRPWRPRGRPAQVHLHARRRAAPPL